MNRFVGIKPSRCDGLVPIIPHVRGSTVGRLGLVAFISCVALAGCGSNDASIEAPKAVKASDGPGYNGHPHLPSMASLSPTERLALTAGSEANFTEFEEVSDAVHGYLDARAEGEWELACSYISGAGQRLLQGSGEKEGDEDTSCPSVLPQHTIGSPGQLRREANLADVGSVRIGGGASSRGEVIYRVANSLRVMSISGVSGKWELTSINPMEIG